MKQEGYSVDSYASARFIDEPIAPASGRFALDRPHWPDHVRPDTCDVPAVRPWGLRGLVPATPGPELPAVRYDHVQQVAVLDDGTGRALVDVLSGPPTAPTTQTVDGQDPPSSEDWVNDFAPDAPSWPC